MIPGQMKNDDSIQRAFLFHLKWSRAAEKVQAKQLSDRYKLYKVKKNKFLQLHIFQLVIVFKCFG